MNTKCLGGRCRSVVAAVAVTVGSAAHAQSLDSQLLYDSRYNQISSSAPTNPYTNIGLAFAWNVSPAASYMDLESPEEIITMDPIGGGFFQGNAGSSSTRAGLLEQMPSGEYLYYWEDKEFDGYSQELVQPHAAGLWPAQIPAFTPATWQGLQSMDPSAAFIVTVNQFVPSPQSNLNIGGMFVSRESNGDYGAPVLTQIGTGPQATLTSRTIPAGALLPNTRYFVTWYFAQEVNSPGFTPPGHAASNFRASTRTLFTTGSGEPECAADFNDDGFLNSADFFDFLVAFFGNDPSADFNGDTFINSQDLFDFLGAFFEGC